MVTTGSLFKEDVSVGEGIVRVLEEAGIDMVFGISGGNMGHLFDALYDHKSTIRTVLVRHESLASIMAEVYGRLTGRPGVCLGQGAFMVSNALLGTLEAHMGSSPMLLLTDLSDQAPFSQHAPYQAGTGEYGGFDAKQTFSGVTKYTTVPQDPVQAVQSTQLAIKHALSGEAGPVAVLYHSTALDNKVGPNSLPCLYPTRSYLPTKQAGNLVDIESAAKALLEAKQPVIIAGNGVRIGQAYKELQELSELLGAPVGTTAAGKGVFPEIHDLALGVIGNFGQVSTNTFVGQADVVIAVGTRLGVVDTAKENPELLDPRRQVLIQIDVEPKNAGWTYPCKHVVIGDASLVLSRLKETIQGVGRPSKEILISRKERLNSVRRDLGFFDFPEYASSEVPILPQRVIADIQKTIRDDAFIACDAGENRLFMTHFFQTKSAGSLIMPSTGAMGYAIPAAMAAKLIDPERQVIAVTGDGGFGMAMNGMLTALEENISIVTVIFNNSALGWVKHVQEDRVGHTIATDLRNVDYAEIARAMGCRSVRVTEPDQLEKALTEALSWNEPAVVDVVTSQKMTYNDVTSPLTVCS